MSIGLIEDAKIDKQTRKLLNFDSKVDFCVGVYLDDICNKKNKKIKGIDFESDISILPSYSYGCFSMLNSVGYYYDKKNSKKTQLKWIPKSWYSKKFGVNYKYVGYLGCYKKFLYPIEMLFYFTNTNNNKPIIIVDKILNKNKSCFDDLLFSIYLTYEIFNNARIFSLSDIKYNRELCFLYNWEEISLSNKFWKKCLNVDKICKSAKYLLQDRIMSYDNVKFQRAWKGLYGYSDFLVFELSEYGLYFFEPIIYGNKTYIMKGSWDKISLLSKKEIINPHNPYLEHLIKHDNNWYKNFLRYLL